MACRKALSSAEGAGRSAVSGAGLAGLAPEVVNSLRMNSTYTGVSDRRDEAPMEPGADCGEGTLAQGCAVQGRQRGVPSEPTGIRNTSSCIPREEEVPSLM